MLQLTIINNLKEAIIGESNAKKKYELFSQQALKENLPFISKLFRAIAYAESVHIKNHLKALSVLTGKQVKPEEFVKIDESRIKKIVKNTSLNLKNAIEGELYETKKMYKDFVKNAKKNKNDVAELTFFLARKAEKVHAKLYEEFLKKLKNKEKLEMDIKIYVCEICGNVELMIKPSKCPICDHSEKFFKLIE